MTTTTRTDELLARADATIAGGAITQFALPGGERRVLARGSGARVWDVDGREYVDYVLGSGPLVIGHCHPRVVEAVQRQAALGATFYALNEPVVQLAERIVERVPCAELVAFSATGAEATFYALRLARAATGRDAVLKFEGGFHGSSDYAQMSLFPTGRRDYPAPEPTSSGIPRALEDDVLVAPYNDLEATRAIVEAHAERLAAIIVEPFQRVIEPRRGSWRACASCATATASCSSSTRSSPASGSRPGGAQERYGVTPDLATFGKVIGGGYSAGRGRRTARPAGDRRPRAPRAGGATTSTSRARSTATRSPPRRGWRRSTCWTSPAPTTGWRRPASACVRGSPAASPPPGCRRRSWAWGRSSRRWWSTGR